MLASIFKDVYTKDIIRRDTLSNLVKSKRGQSSSHHERYVEELQQVRLASTFTATGVVSLLSAECPVGRRSTTSTARASNKLTSWRDT